MKMNEIIMESDAKEKDNNDEICLVCHTHEKAYEQISNNIRCPYCGEKHSYYDFSDDDFVVVGEANFYDPEHRIAKYLTISCNECGKSFSLFPEKVIYNANHDIYYTGGREYLSDEDELKIFEKANKQIEKSLQQWINRYEAGDKLEASYPALWIEGHITTAISEYLFYKGLKK